MFPKVENKSFALGGGRRQKDDGTEMEEVTHLSDETARTVRVAAVRVLVFLAGLDLLRLALFCIRPEAHSRAYIYPATASQKQTH